ncbi:MAG: STAS domain-containing protein [Bernardetiaceae bacterium]
MKLTLTTTSSYYIIAVEGDVDASSSIELDNTLEELLQAQPPKHILVDCTDLQYISSPGIGVFTSRLEESEEKNIKIVLFGLNEKVFKVFRILGLDTLMDLVQDLPAAQQTINL